MTTRAATVGPMTSSAPQRSTPGRPHSASADLRRDVDRGVAAAAGVGKTTLYLRYPNKSDLVVGALGSVAAILPEQLDSGSVRDDILALIRHTQDVMRRTGIGFSMAGTFLVKESDEPMLLALFRERVMWPRIALGTRILRRGIQRGELRPDIEPEVVLPMLVASTFARHLAGLPGDEAWLATMVDTVWRGSRPRSHQGCVPSDPSICAACDDMFGRPHSFATGGVALCLYHVTALYFEAEHEDDYCKVGYSGARSLSISNRAPSPVNAAHPVPSVQP